jgi:D-sedoheptulose 7-phosphate isomerase
MNDRMIKESFVELIDILGSMKTQAEKIEEIAKLLIKAFKNGKKVIIFGNGGSYADAIHFAAEFEGPYKNRNRPPLPALVPGNPSALTAIANDFGYEHVFKKFVEANAEKGDIVIGLTTSGTSKNIIFGLTEARRKGAIAIGFTGRTGGKKMSDFVDIIISVPSDNTPRIQEMHRFIYHEICGLVEKNLFG